MNNAVIYSGRAAVLDVAPITGPTFWASVAQDSEAFRVSLSGNGDVRAQEALEAFLGQLHGEAMRVGATQVELDCRELKFMNSCCLKALVSWIGAVQDSGGHYRICFLSNPRLHWQKRSFRALTCFAAELVTIQQ
jgi:anti-anti-sigma factor